MPLNCVGIMEAGCSFFKQIFNLLPFLMPPAG
jgi:hypothetical protein